MSGPPQSEAPAAVETGGQPGRLSPADESQQPVTSAHGGTRSDGDVTATTRVQACEEQQHQQQPPPPPARWLSADRRRVVLEAEPAKSNLARAHTLQGVADRLRQRAATEARQLLRLKEEVESATGAQALDGARLWFLELSFRRRLRHHLQLVFREMHHLCEVRAHFDADAVVRSAGGPALLLLDDLRASGNDAAPDTNAAAPDAAASALPAAPTASGRHTPEARERGDSNASSAADGDYDQEVSEAEEVCAEVLGSSGDSGWAAAEEVAAAVAAAAIAGGGRRGRHERRFSPVQWSRERFEKRRCKDNSGSSNGSNESSGNTCSNESSGHTCSTGSDGVLKSVSAPQEGSAPAPEAAAEDTVIFADADECWAVAALEVFCELQRQFQQLADALRQHALVADGVLSKAAQRRLPGGGEGAGAEERPNHHQQLLLHDIALLHVDMQRTQASVSRSEVCLQRVVSSLPPAPTMVRLPPTPPLRTPRRGLAWFSSILKKRFSRRQ